RLPAAELGAVLAAAAVVAGAAPQVAPAAVRAVEERARALGRAMGRRERKALALEASRFGFEPLDAAAFREALLMAADRLGLLLASDVVTAARTAGDLPDGALSAATVTASPRALALVRFALGEDYLTLRREAGMVEST